MSTRASATRYARALLDVAITESQPERAEQDLAAFLDLFDRHPDLQKALTHPTVAVAGKRAVVQQILARLQPTSPAGKLLLLLADRDRLALAPEILEVYRDRLTEYRQIVRAEITTAGPLPQDGAAALEQRLSTATGRTVTLTTRVDPAIIGGMVTRIGGTVYDGSVATQLETIRQHLAGRF